MSDAADFHIQRSKHSIDVDDNYEFDDALDRVFPAELLAIMQARRRLGLPEFSTGHALVDAPWVAIKTLKPAPADPLLARLEEKVAHDLPEFR